MKFVAASGLGVEALHARYVTHEYERHAHDFYVMGVIDSGAADFSVEGRSFTAPAGSAMLINPGESHDGRAMDEEGYVYSMVYVDRSVLSDLAGELETPGEAELAFRAPVMSDPSLIAHLRTLHRALFEADDLLACDIALVEALGPILESMTRRSSARSPGDELRLKRLRDYMHAHYNRALTTTDLAAASGLGRSQLNQLFRAAYGLPLHAYLNGVRLDAAKELLLSGMGGAEVAVTVGLSDQSHLIRRFKGSFGITPSQYVQGHRTIVQSPD